MARGRYLWDEELQTWAPRHEVLRKRAAKQPNNMSTLPRPMVIGSMDPIKSPINGQIFDSKSAYYRHVEQNNCSIVGFDKNWEQHIPPAYDEKAHTADIVSDIKRATQEANAL